MSDGADLGSFIDRTGKRLSLSPFSEQSKSRASQPANWAIFSIMRVPFSRSCMMNGSI